MNLLNEPNDSATPKPFLDFFLKGVKGTTVFYKSSRFQKFSTSSVNVEHNGEK